MTMTTKPRGKALDNLVIMFDDLDDGVARYRDLGFTVVPGGSHANGTKVALVAFADGTYLQLMAFERPAPSHRFWKGKQQGGGFIGLCVVTETVADDVAAIRAAGVPIGEPEHGARTRPDGVRLEWSIASSPEPFGPQTAVLVEDHTLRDERVPRERAHANGVAGIAGISIAVDDLGPARAWWSAALGQRGVEIVRRDLEATGVRFTAGQHTIEVITPASDASPIATWLAARGPSPYAAMLTAEGACSIDERRAGARLSIV
jgi:hypothetical protein